MMENLSFLTGASSEVDLFFRTNPFGYTVVLETFLVASFRKTKTLRFGGYEKTRLFA